MAHPRGRLLPEDYHSTEYPIEVNGINPPGLWIFVAHCYGEIDVHLNELQPIRELTWDGQRRLGIGRAGR